MSESITMPSAEELRAVMAAGPGPDPVLVRGCYLDCEKFIDLVEWVTDQMEQLPTRKERRAQMLAIATQGIQIGLLVARRREIQALERRVRK